MEFETLDDRILKEMIKAGLNPVTQYEEVERISSGSLAVDWTLSGGFPRGRYSMIYGEETSGKSTLFFICAANLMRQDPNAIVGFIETGGEATDPQWLHKLGIDMTRFVHIQPDTTEQALNALRTMISKKLFSLICLDSIAAMASAAEVNKEIGDMEWSINARLLNDYFKRDSQQLRQSNIKKRNLVTGEMLGEEAPPAILLVNQVRDSMALHGDPERIPGGRQLRHACSIIARLKKPNTKEISLDTDSNIAQIVHNIKVKKNKVGPPFRATQYFVRNDPANRFFGVDMIQESINLAIDTFGLISNRTGGKWLSGAPFFRGEEILIDNELDVPNGMRKGRYRLAALLYKDEDLRLQIMTSVISELFASKHDDSIKELGFEAEAEIEA